MPGGIRAGAKLQITSPGYVGSTLLPSVEGGAPHVLSRAGVTLGRRGRVPSSMLGINYGVITLARPQKYWGEEKALARIIILASGSSYNNNRGRLK